MTQIRNIVFSVLILVVSACAAEPDPRNVLVLMVDALRADHLGCYGYERDTSPHIDALANQSVRFVNAYAQSPWTKPSIPTLFTSLYPLQHGVYEGETPGSAGHLESDVLADEFLTLAEVFQEAGFRTGAFVNNAHLLASQGFAQGFDFYEQGDFDAVEIQRRFLEFVDQEPERPFFAYLHYLDVHWPFEPEPPFDRRFLDSDGHSLPGPDGWSGLRDGINEGAIQLSDEERSKLVALHDAGIAELDHRIGVFLATLRTLGLLEQTVILLTSDHGEELFEHGRVGHGSTLFDEVIRIPMMIRFPGGAGARTVEEDPARLLDVYPTLLGALGLGVPSHVEGRDLLGSSNGTPEIVAETRHKRRYRVSLRRGDWKYIRTYRAPGIARLAAERPDTFGLRPGMRVKVKGRFVSDGSLVARRVSVKDAGDDDVELSGPVSNLDAETREFEIYSFRVVPSRKLTGPRGVNVLKTLRAGEWVKIEGDIATGTTLVADKLERLPESNPDTELEGIIQEIRALPNKSARAVIGNAAVVLTDDTKIKAGAVPEGQAAVSVLPPNENPFPPERLLAEEGFVMEALLFDLGNDPGEKTNLVAHEAERSARFGRELEIWLERMARTAAPERKRRQRLDHETIERLRTLGYVE